MASIIKIVKLSKQLPIRLTNPCFINSVRTAVNNRDWKPGPFPKTEEERIKAARKYNLHPDEYDLVPEDEPTGIEYIGDYPRIPMIGFDAKDPYYPYDMPHDRRNYNETLPENFDMLGGDRLSEMGMRKKHTTWYAVKVFLSYIGVLVGLYWIGEHYKQFRPVTCEQFPAPGVKHYTFEPAK